jgi:sec-independent protein translocase protein TatB
MFNIGIGEVILIMAVALVFLGPEKFPVVAKTVLHAYRDLRGYYDEVKGEVIKELNPVKKELSELSRYKPEDYVESLAYTVASEKDRDADKPAEEGENKAEVKTEDEAKPDSTPPIPEAREGSPYGD